MRKMKRHSSARTGASGRPACTSDGKDAPDDKDGGSPVPATVVGAT